MEAEYDGSIKRMFFMPTAVVGEQFWSILGIGLQATDSILRCAGKHRFNEFRALIKQTGTRYCRPKQGLRSRCPLGVYLQEGR